MSLIDYWKRRKEGKRGQGDKPNLVVKVITPDHLGNRQRARAKVPSDPKFTKKRGK